MIRRTGTVILALMACALSMPVEPPPESKIDPVMYLARFGYFPEISFRGVGSAPLNQPHVDQNSSVFENAILEFQDFAGLDLTGKLDETTLEKMAQPRCGVADKGKLELRFKRYARHSSRWEKTKLSYFISNYPTDSLLTKSEIDKEISRAFQIWSDSSNLDFKRVLAPEQADIQLDFFRRNHGSDDPFDGRGGVLAHAFFPRWGGDVHFDSDEEWINERFKSRAFSKNAKQLLQTAVHEIGHSLGLEHSKAKRSIMAPFYQGWMDDLHLETDDIQGIQSIYGKSKETATSKPETTTICNTSKRPDIIFGTALPNPSPPGIVPSPSKPDICFNTYFDAATETKDGSFYVFQGDYHWKLTLEKAGFEPQYPRTNQDWGGLPGDVDAAFYNPTDGMTYIFKDDQVGKYFNTDIQPGYPKPISQEFPGAPDRDIDAALLWGKNSQLYLFRGSLYWKYNFDKRTVEDSYPLEINKRWRGVPNNLSAALRWTNGKTYFFKGSSYYRFDDDTFAVDANPRVRYPRTIGKWWLGCHSKPQTDLETEMEEDAGTKRNPRRWAWS
ncbi:hypothetical protein TCAL_07676 [Tigriopus californicus]|uniref:Peptidase metallopeptidase domain-containing protein n=2 Tax=Tigriopus californicus TaxID=6832 RepID=A0A553NVA1_TIGCA|nr:hypothetical protein TCAL_07676 [Tigriopus californicus]|eukprot:TCALIF_07676-PA protein Name:"Similar to MMP14 Matrix metalloproteinase-14 (Bos taurus)" AED:0.01 eAED:0.01 QI:0/-1/0/1/-1/1/1/0/555